MTQSETNLPCISLNTHHTADCFKWWTASLIYILHKLPCSVTASFVTLDKGLCLPDVKWGSQYDTMHPNEITKQLLVWTSQCQILAGIFEIYIFRHMQSPY
jgi:hypothetical protein